MTKTFTTIYRTGGTENFAWKRCLAVLKCEEAEAQKSAMERAGYKAMIFDTALLDSVGMPSTYEYSQQ